MPLAKTSNKDRLIAQIATLPLSEAEDLLRSANAVLNARRQMGRPKPTGKSKPKVDASTSNENVA